MACPIPGSGAALLRFIFGGQRDKLERDIVTGREEGGTEEGGNKIF